MNYATRMRKHPSAVNNSLKLIILIANSARDVILDVRAGTWHGVERRSTCS